MKLFFVLCLNLSFLLRLAAEEIKIEQLKAWFAGDDFPKMSRAARILESEKYLETLKKWQNEDNTLLAKRAFVLIKRIVKNDDYFLRTLDNIKHVDTEFGLHQEKIYKYFDWLIKQQNPDGSWGKGNVQAMTAFAVYSLNSQGTSIKEKYKVALVKGIKWLVNSPLDVIKNHGYPLAVMACALGDSYKFYELEGLEEKLKKCLQIIIEGQQDKGAFNYNYSKSGNRQDFHFSSWQYDALFIAKKKGLEIKGLKEAVDKSISLLSEIINSEFNFPYTTSNYNFKDLSFSANHNFRGVYNYLSLKETKKLPEKYMNDLREFNIPREMKDGGRREMYSIYFFTLNSFLLSMDIKKHYEMSIASYEKFKQEDGSWMSEFSLSLKDETDRKIFTSYYAVRILSLPYHSSYK